MTFITIVIQFWGPTVERMSPVDGPTQPKDDDMKTVLTVISLGLALSMGPAFAASHAGAGMKAGDAGCEAKAAEKKLAGAAKNSFVKKCEGDAKAGAAAACEQSAMDKKLAGAAKNSHIKKCMSDAKPMAAAAPAPAAAAAPAAAPAAKPAAAASGAKK
jgi:hypothetical protein